MVLIIRSHLLLLQYLFYRRLLSTISHSSCHLHLSLPLYILCQNFSYSGKTTTRMLLFLPPPAVYSLHFTVLKIISLIPSLYLLLRLLAQPLLLPIISTGSLSLEFCQTLSSSRSWV